MAGAKLIEWANEVNTENMARKPSELAAMFNPPFTTAHVGVISGGTAHNITAKDCHFAMDFRVVPGEDKDAWGTAYLEKVREVEKQMQEVVPETYIEVTPVSTSPHYNPKKTGWPKPSCARSPATTPATRSPTGPRPDNSRKPGIAR